MSVRIFRDIEEALSREVRRITFHDARTVDRVVLQDTYDPFTGEIVSAPIEPDFYDSSADANHIQYPHFFIRLMKSREDRFTGRVVPQYGKWIETTVTNAPGAYEIVVSSSDALITAPGNDITTTLFQIRKVQVGHLIRLLAGNNKGTYKVTSITVSGTGDHTITVSNTLVENLPVALFDATNRIVVFQGPTDLFTVKIGDNFVDSTSTSFPITAIDPNAGTVTIGGVTIPNLAANATITRTGDVFTVTDLSLRHYIVMDPTKPVVASFCPDTNLSSKAVGVSPAVPIDAFYLIRIDSKTRDNHIDTLNRVWEEFNPPRTGLPVIKRTSLSAEQVLTVDIPTGGSDTVTVGDNTDFHVGDAVYLFDDFAPSKREDGEGFERPFSSKVVGKISTNQLKLADIVPDTFKVSKCSKVVSNAEFQLLMFHFVDHVTKDVEGSQYWVHEFTFWVQLWIDRLELPEDLTAITNIDIPMEDLQGNVIIED